MITRILKDGMNQILKVGFLTSRRPAMKLICIALTSDHYNKHFKRSLAAAVVDDRKHFLMTTNVVPNPNRSLLRILNHSSYIN